MRLINKTGWSNRHLKALLQRAAEMELESEHRRRMVVQVRYTRGPYSGCSGYAWIKSNHCIVRIPSVIHQSLDMTKVRRDFAHVAAHEFAHCRGVEHRHMRGYLMHRGGYEKFLWADKLPLEPSTPKPTAKKTVTYDSRAAHADAMIVQWTSKHKRAATGLRTWRRKAAYYRRQAAALQKG